MSQIDEWGHKRRYYSHPNPPDKKEGWSKTEQETLNILTKNDPDLPNRVERAFKQWNQIIRDYLRNEMALRLSIGDKVATVPVRIVPGLPRPLESVLRGRENQIELLLNRPLIERTATGLNFLVEGYKGHVEQHPKLLDIAGTGDIYRALAYVEELKNFLSRMELAQKIQNIPEDIFGAYFFRVPRIDLYWMAIGLEANLLNVSPEALTIVVAAHELAHAYSHLGRDIDGKRWADSAFAGTDLGIVEGIAQFYTKVICRRLRQRAPEAERAFQSLASELPEPYRVQETWTKDEQAAGEIVRITMIQARSQGVRSYNQFERILEEHREALTTPHEPKPSKTNFFGPPAN